MTSRSHRRLDVMRPFTRREVLAAGGTISLAGVVAACQSDAPRAVAPTTTAPARSTSAASSGAASTTAAGAAPIEPVTISEDALRQFDAAVSEAMTTFGLVGAGVALFQGSSIVYNKGFGVRDLESNEPVTDRTRFHIASNTKSMTSLLMARYVDDGVLDWDTPAVELWPEFQGPTPELTQSLTIADFLGMGSGVAEPETIEFFVSSGAVDALDALRSIAHLPVIGPPDTAYYYNNTFFSAAPFVAMLANGTEPADLAETYANELRRVIFDPIGMPDAAVIADPRPLGPDVATGYHVDLFGAKVRTPFVSIDGYGPAGAAVASTTDMARYLITQMQGGVTPEGVRVVSAANVARTHQPGIDVPPDSLNALPTLLLPDTTAMNYCLGWFDQTFNDGRHQLWHAGGIDGFGSLMGFFPREQVGFVFLTNLEPANAGLFNISIQSTLLSLLFGLNKDLPGVLAGTVPTSQAAKASLAATTGPIDPAAVAPYLGLYSQGFQLRLDPPDTLRLVHDIRSMPVLAQADGTHIVAGGPSAVAARTLTLATAADGTRTMTIAGYEPFRWLSGD